MTLKKVWKKSVKQNTKTYFCSSFNYFQLQKLRQGSSFVIQLDIIGWCKMSAGLIGSFETKFNEILWLSQSYFLWEEVRKRVGHANSYQIKFVFVFVFLLVFVFVFLLVFVFVHLLCTFFVMSQIGYTSTCKLPFNSSTNLCFLDSKLKCGIKQQISQHFTSNLIGC